MKPLQIVDSVMLSTARGFTAATFWFFFLPVAFCLFVLGLGAFVFLFRNALMLIFPHLRDIIQSDAPSFPALPHPLVLISYTYTAIWFASVRLLPSGVARICLGISGGLFAVYFGYCLTAMIADPTGMALTGFGLLMILLILLGFIGFGSMLWVSLRPPNLEYAKFGGPLSRSVNSV